MEAAFPQINWTVVISAFIGALPLIIAQLVNLVVGMRSRDTLMQTIEKSAVEIRVIKKATNGMRKQLVKQAGVAGEIKGHKAGVADQKATEMEQKS